MAAGLAQRGRGGGLYDRFRGRIMFPLADARGRVLGFGARQMGEDRGPKYLNTSENDLYHKGRQLFGIDVRAQGGDEERSFRGRGGLHRCARASPGRDSRGRRDHGHRDDAGAAGRAGEGRRLEPARLVFLALDADRAGRDAMLRAARLAEDRGVDLRVVDMPEGTDPADLVARTGPMRS